MASSTLRFNSPVALSSSRHEAAAVPPSSSRLSSYSEFKGLKLQIQMPCSKYLSTAMVSRRRGTRLVCGAQDTITDFPTVTDATWKSLVLEADVPVLVEFAAPWCGPCRIIHPVVAQLSEEYAGKFNFFKLNTDECPSIATRYGIRTVPAMIIFVNGEKKDTVLGAVPKTTLTAAIKKFL